MSRQNLNFLWLMIVCCASHQISFSKRVIVGNDFKDPCFGDSCNTDFKLTCPSGCETDIKDVYTMNVKMNTSSLGQCKTLSGKTRDFSITNDGGKYEVRMNETCTEIELWFLPDGMTCQQVRRKPGLVTCTCNNPVCTSICTLGSPLTDCTEIPSVDLKTMCQKATYDNDICRENEASKYLLRSIGNEWKCVICDKTPTACNPTNKTACLKPPETTYNLTSNGLKDEDGFINPSNASVALDSLEPLVERMKKDNKSSAGVVMGDVIGILQMQAGNTETENLCYSIDQNMINILDCQSDLNTDFPWSLTISSEAVDKSRLENNGSAFAGILRFKNMGKLNETKNYTVLNNEVYGITMWAKISNLTDNIEIFFTQKDLVGEASCSSWDGKGNLTWTTSGCETVKINNTIKCSCSHLTFFAVLMSPPDVNANITDYVDSLSFITSIGCSISMFFLSVALFMYFLRKAKSKNATKILINMFVALFLLDLSFLSNESIANTEVKAACVFIALLMHYSMLATFTWFSIQVLHMYLCLIRQNITITNYMMKITVFGWTIPALIVIAVDSVGGYKAVIINTTPGKTTQMCWITDLVIHYIVNIGYYTLVFIFTTGIFITICTRIVQTRRRRAADGKKKTFRKQLMMVLSLFLLFGLTWAVAFFSYGEMLIPSYYIFTVLNSFQGFFLFLYYYHIHKDIEGRFSDDPERSNSTTTIVQSRNNTVKNVYDEPN
ncbi:adhesion G-protein coupled receptor G1-like [Megalobrama amblycephala]|uniref:adhesion G-protein coupled receptor G1-like n=1 Tax=Megalobrama amblycephala TaxID=75352 RepID=UPI00201470C8|nr:adhesion G-protein coupled receptor G1-like [Megalobrama amblycephala]